MLIGKSRQMQTTLSTQETGNIILKWNLSGLISLKIDTSG
jgi:hypothetical protein